MSSEPTYRTCIKLNSCKLHAIKTCAHRLQKEFYIHLKLKNIIKYIFPLSLRADSTWIHNYFYSGIIS